MIEGLWDLQTPNLVIGVVFPEGEASRILKNLTGHETPFQHSSWLSYPEAPEEVFCVVKMWRDKREREKLQPKKGVR